MLLKHCSFQKNKTDGFSHVLSLWPGRSFDNTGNHNFSLVLQQRQCLFSFSERTFCLIRKMWSCLQHGSGFHTRSRNHYFIVFPHSMSVNAYRSHNAFCSEVGLIKTASFQTQFLQHTDTVFLYSHLDFLSFYFFCIAIYLYQHLKLKVRKIYILLPSAPPGKCLV